MPIISYEELKEHVGGGTIDEVIVRLNKLKINYLKGKRGRPFTTEFALNAAMGLTSSENIPREPLSPHIEIG